MTHPETVFLKLGGSLITDKSKNATARVDHLARISAEIAASQSVLPGLQLVLGHGSGSFGHVPARKYGTRKGVSSQEGWRGFAEVWRQANILNRLVIDALQDAGLPAIAFPPSTSLIARSSAIETWDTTPIQSALANGLLPVVYGDVAFDRVQGGTIVSTEDVFGYLAPVLQPGRVLIAGIEDGVWADYPDCTRLIPAITPDSYSQAASAISGSAHTDVTGGMDAKVRQMLALVRQNPAIEVLIFGGSAPGAITAALAGTASGTRITNR